MNYYERVQKSIDYIEENLKQELPLETVASKAYMSIANFYRLFYAFTGHSVKDYIRRRRLSDASEELLRKERRVLDLSMDYQFDSPESFSRAFRREYGRNPADFRKAGSPVIIFERVNLLKNEFLLSPEEMEKYPDIKIIKELPPMEVAYCVGRGYCAEFDSQKVLLQWLKDNHLEKKGYRIFGFDNGGLGEDHTYETWFAFGEDISGYADSRVRVKTFSGGQYAVMSTKLEQIESAWQRFGEWLHNSRFEHGGHQYLEEHLPGNGEEINENTRMDLYMPIRERETHSELPSTRPLVFEEPKLIEKAAFTLIGLKCDTSEQEEAQNHKVAKTWDRFNKKEHRKIRDIEDTSGGYGVFLYPPVQDGTYSYICGFHTKDSAEVPEGMVSHQQPGSRYAVFTYKSPIRTELDMSGVFAMYAHIFGQWLPTSHYRFDERSHTFEYYQRHRMMRDFPEFDIYVPVV